jgi:hypothetical protein
MRTPACLLLAVCFLLLVPAQYADEGMWTFDNPPLKFWREKYGFEPTKDWLDHLRLATVRLSENNGAGATGCFVSADGLIFTNQHVGAGQVAKLSSQEHDYIKEGFYAPTHAAELRCPDMETSRSAFIRPSSPARTIKRPPPNAAPPLSKSKKKPTRKAT